MRYEKSELILMKRFERRDHLGELGIPARKMLSGEANDQEGAERIRLDMILCTETLTEVGHMSD